MIHVIAVPNSLKQKEVMDYIYFRLQEIHHTDISITIAKQHFSRINVLQRVNGNQVMAASYHVVITPISVSLDKLHGFNGIAQLNVNPLLRHLEEVKANILAFTQSSKIEKKINKKEDDEYLVRAVTRLFE